MLVCGYMNSFSAFGSISKGWELFKKRPGFFVLTVIIVAVIYVITSALFGKGSFIGPVLGQLVSFIVGLFVSMGLTAVSLKAYNDPASATYGDLWHPQPFFSFLIASVLTGIATVVGFILLIVPGILAVIVFYFAKYLVIDRNMGAIEAMRESMRITKGARWELFVFILVVIALNVLGALCVLVGLLITIPVTLMASVAAYRALAVQSEASVSPEAPVSATA
jgi:hypothetical protein